MALWSLLEHAQCAKRNDRKEGKPLIMLQDGALQVGTVGKKGEVWASGSTGRAAIDHTCSRFGRVEEEHVRYLIHPGIAMFSSWEMSCTWGTF